MDKMPQEIRVAVLSGGSSGERAVSIESGKGVTAALREAGFCVENLDPSSKEDLVRLIQEPYDVCFLALHGKGGEDGTIQGFLETIGLPYTGPGVWASATAIDKIKSKSFYRSLDVNTPRSLVLESEHTPVCDVVESVGVHCVVKAATEGSALGVYICHTEREIADAMSKVFQVDTAAFVEEYIPGDEFTVAVLDDGGEPKALPVIKIVPSHEFYDYESKYAAGGSQHICPAPLSEDDFRKAQELAVRAHQALECTGVSRTDLIQDENGEFWVLETNTLPGMTATSLLPDAARAAGMDFPTLCTKMVFSALAE